MPSRRELHGQQACAGPTLLSGPLKRRRNGASAWTSAVPRIDGVRGFRQLSEDRINRIYVALAGVAKEGMARPKRFELLTPRFVVWCSIQLSYGRVFAIQWMIKPITAIRQDMAALQAV